MTFEAYETSKRGGKPTHLFLFGRQSKAWRFAACDRDVTIGGNTYTAAAISRGSIKQSVETQQNSVVITLPFSLDPNAAELPNTQAFGSNWLPFVPSDPISVSCMATHLNDPDQEIVVEWLGFVQQPKFDDAAQTLQLTCVPPGQIAKAMYQGAKWQIACWKTPYSTGIRGCNLVSSDFEIAATLTAVSGLNLTADAFGTAPFNLAGGEIWWTRTDGIVERCPIWAHTGTTITLLYGAADLAIGLAVTVRPPCPGTWAACTARNNTANYGGAIYEPVQNPYDGSMSWE
jgi:hypothetical protein